MRTTIDFGIYLGIHNSAIAVLEDNHAKIIKNNDDMDFTPCVVHIDRKGILHIGKTAKNRLEHEPEDAYGEFKLQMGSETVYTFKRSGRQMRPEELTAEVLKSLRSDVQQRMGEDIQAAVITVPAAFELPQCQATQRAAQMAGFKISPLIMEPTAAAMAYAVESTSNRVFWLVYDLSGGTFDAAVIQLLDGKFHIVNHAGDNHLGGKLIDWDIVEKLLVPAVQRIAPLTNFTRTNPKWRAAFAKLKWAAEEAKIKLSHDQKYSIVIDFLCLDDRGEPVSFDFEITRSDLARIALPYIQRSVNLSRQALSEARLNPAEIEKVILVGGPSLAPYVREQLSDPKEGLGLKLDFSHDPLTVVAQGAAIFAGTQRMDDAPPPPPPGSYQVELEYNPRSADSELRIGGKIVGTNGETLSGFLIEFIDHSSHYRSGKIPVNPNGTFLTSLLARAGTENVYQIELIDASGRKVQCKPSEVKYTRDFQRDPSVLIHSIGLAISNNQVTWLINKGASLPARQCQVLRTEVSIRSGRMDAISLPILEGQNQRADRNRLIGYLTVRGHCLKGDLPAGSEIEITIEVDETQLISGAAYIPQLDQEIHNILEIQKPKPDLVFLRRTLDAEMKRMQNLRELSSKTNDPTSLRLLREKVDAENMIHNLEGTLAAAAGDPDTAEKALNLLLDLQIALDEVEQAIQTIQVRNKPAPPIEPAIAQPVQAIHLQIDNLRQGLPVEVKEVIRLAEANLTSTKAKQVQSAGKQLTNACQNPSIPELIQAITSFDQGITSTFGEEMNFLIWRSESLKRRVELLGIQTSEMAELFRQLNRQMFNADLQSAVKSIQNVSQLLLKYLQEGSR